MKRLLLILFICSVSAFKLTAQDTNDSDEKKEQSADDLAKELSNPNAARGLIFTQFDYTNYSGDIPNAGQNGVVFNLQPSLPIPIGPGTNIFVRPLIPIYLSQPVAGADGFSQKAGIGNISADVALGKTWKSGFMGMVGVFAGFPTASIEALKAPSVSLGPEIVLGYTPKWGFVGVMVNHGWGLGDPNVSGQDFSILQQDAFVTSTAGVPRRTSVTAGQYFYVVGVGNGWQISGTPTFAYNHEGEEGNRLTFPVGTGVIKVTNFGKLPVKIALQYWYYVASPDNFGPQHLIRLQIAPVVPLPWGKK